MINNYAIKQKEDKQPVFGQIYNLGLVKLKILKIYIETNLVNSFIQHFKSLVKASIFFYQKLDKSLCFYADY